MLLTSFRCMLLFAIVSALHTLFVIVFIFTVEVEL